MISGLIAEGWKAILGAGATERILKRYGVRSNAIINGTGTGTQLVLSLSNYNKTSKSVEEIFEKDGNLYITALSPNGSPIRPHSMVLTGVRRTLTGRLLHYRKYPTIDIDVTVIGNSLDFYRLSMLSAFYARSGIKTLIPPDTSDNEVVEQRAQGTYEFAYTEKTDIPLLDMSIVSNSAPGANIKLSGGVMTDADPIMGVDGNSRISDKTFSFSFAAMSVPSWSNQFYDPNGMGAFESFIAENTGIEFR